MKECMMVHRVGRTTLIEGVTSPGLSTIDNWQRTQLECLQWKHVLGNCTRPIKCCNLSHPVNKLRHMFNMRNIVYITTVPLSRVVSVLLLIAPHHIANIL